MPWAELKETAAHSIPTLPSSLTSSAILMHGSHWPLQEALVANLEGSVASMLLADGAAQKPAWGSKRDSGAKLCFLCDNIRATRT